MTAPAVTAVNAAMKRRRRCGELEGRKGRGRVGPSSGGRGALALALVMSTAGCGDAELGCQEGAACEGDVRVATWWYDEMTRDPVFLQPLETSLEQRTTVTLDHQAVDGKHCHLRKVWAAMGEAGAEYGGHAGTDCPDVSPDEPPFDAVLFNNGQDVSALTECGPNAAHSLRALEGEFPPGWFAEAYPRDLLPTLSCRGHVYALPIGIHRINHVVYNRQLFGEAGYASPGELSLDQLLGAARAIRDVLDRDGKSAAPVFAVPLKDGDALSRFFIENVMLATSGAEAYVDYWTGCPVPDGLFVDALDWVQQLSAFFGQAADDPIAQLVRGDAAMLVTGDWAMVDAIGSEETLGSMPFPGTQQHFVYSADVFALPANGNEAKGLAWLHAISEPQAQAGFAERKYAIPGRLDVAVPGSMHDPRQDANLIRALPALLDGNGAFGDLANLLERWAGSNFGDPSELVSYAAAEYQSLADQRAACDVDVTPAPSPEVTQP